MAVVTFSMPIAYTKCLSIAGTLSRSRSPSWPALAVSKISKSKDAMRSVKSFKAFFSCNKMFKIWHLMQLRFRVWTRMKDLVAQAITMKMIY